MKKILIAIAAIGALNFGAKAQGDMLTGGTFIHLGAFMPNSTYGTFPENKGIGLSLQFGQNFTIAELSTVAIGIRETWIEFAGTSYQHTYSAANKGYIFHGSLFKTGPQVSFAFGDAMAADIYYQVSPTVAVMGDFSNPNATSAASLTQSTGFMFRYNRLNLGFEYAFGRLRDNDTRAGGDLEGWNIHYRATNIKVNLGFQFNK